MATIYTLWRTVRLSILFLSLMTGCDTRSQQSVAYSRDWPSEPSSATPDSPNQYKILRVSKKDKVKNVDILLDSSKLFPHQIIKSATLFKSMECQALPCYVVTIWDSEQALTLYESQQNNPLWRKKHWPFICEHYVADYNVTVSEMRLYPFMDSEYRRWGGKIKRPVKHSFAMP